jgi:hypothetical protein
VVIRGGVGFDLADRDPLNIFGAAEGANCEDHIDGEHRTSPSNGD